MNFVVYIKVAPYLRQWFLHRYGGKEDRPIVFPRKSPLQKLLHTLIEPRPASWKPDKPIEDGIPIMLPSMESKDPKRWCFIKEKHRRVLARMMKLCFEVDCYSYLKKMHGLGRIPMLKDAIYGYMEMNGIDVVYYDTICKWYQRAREEDETISEEARIRYRKR